MMLTRHPRRLFFAVLFVVLFVLLRKQLSLMTKHYCVVWRNYLNDDIVDFSLWDNVTGFPEPIVPNIVHFVKLENPILSFDEMVVILSAWCHQQPERLIIHCNCDDLRGNYWHRVRQLAGVEVRRVVRPTMVFGKPLSSVYHAGDVARLAVLQEFGGIALDLDSYVVQPLDEFRRFEFTIGWPPGDTIGCQVMVAHKNARFLDLYLDSYQHYQGFRWYYNAGELPTRLLEEQPHLVHRVPWAFGVHHLFTELYQRQWNEWQTMYTVHLLIRHRAYLDKESPVKHFDEDNIRTYNYTYGQMARQVLYGTMDLIYDDQMERWNLTQCRS